MKLGAFSVSLSVSDISASGDFYEKLGFSIVGGVKSENWLIMRNGECTIGLFQGMFQGNILTFNPGWDSEASPVEAFDDIRKIRESLVEFGIHADAIEGESGPGSFMISDPDGNAILFDQHV